MKTLREKEYWTVHVQLQLFGENWIKEFIKGLSEENKKNIIEEKSYKTFKSGGGEVRSSINLLKDCH